MDCIGDHYRLIKGITWSLDFSSPYAASAAFAAFRVLNAKSTCTCLRMRSLLHLTRSVKKLEHCVGQQVALFF